MYRAPSKTAPILLLLHLALVGPIGCAREAAETAPATREPTGDTSPDAPRGPATFAWGYETVETFRKGKAPS